MHVGACSYWSPEHAFSPLPVDQTKLLQSEFLAIDHMDQNPHVLMKKTELLIKESRVTEALQVFDQIEKEDVNPSDWLWLQCQISHANGNVKTGIKAGEDLFMLGAGFYDLHIEMATIVIPPILAAEAHDAVEPGD
jgi:pentatricopeptide repeat protein